MKIDQLEFASLQQLTCLLVLMKLDGSLKPSLHQREQSRGVLKKLFATKLS